MCARGGEAAAALVLLENEAESVPVAVPESVGGPNYLDTCPVCLLNFHSREPKLLPCLHSFCKKCLPSPSRNLATAEPPNSHSDSATKPLNVIRCPVCRQECMEVDVMENVFVKDSVEAPSSTVERTSQLCMTCDDNTEAAGFCVDCVEYLCATCVEAHQRVKFTKDHTIRHKTDVSREVSTQRPMFCDNHKQEPLKLFCETCDLLTCRDCQLVGHKDHNYQFLEDAYKNHRDHMESLTHQLQEKRKVIEEVSNAINNGLLQVDQNRAAVHDEIKKSICNLILEINKKGKMLVGQLEALTKDHESVLQKQQEDIGYLSRHLDHVIKFTKWATARNGGTALLYCKRLILFQIGNLLRAKCSTSFIPQSSVRFHCRSTYWASNVDLGSLVVESAPGHQLGGFQGIPHQLSRPGPGASGSPYSLALGASQNTLAQLQMQVDKLNPQAHWQPQPPPPPWTWYQSVRLQRTVPGPLQAGSPSHCMPPQSGRRILMPPHNHISPTSSLPSPGFAPQPLRGSSSALQAKPADVFSSSPLYGHVTQVPLGAGRESSPHTQQMMETAYVNKRNDSLLYTLQQNYPQSLAPSFPNRNVQGHQFSPGYSLQTQDEKPGTVSWNPQEMQDTSSAMASTHKKRRRSSPGPVIVIKDEPDYDGSYVQTSQRASLPDSTGDQTQTSAEDEGNKDPSLHQSAEKTLQLAPLHPLSGPQDQSETAAPKSSPSPEGEQRADPHRAGLEDLEASCAVCQSAGELQRCQKCSRAFHLTCHVPTLLNPPSGEWLCSLCCDLFESDCDGKAAAKTVKKEPACEGGFTPEDKQKCERLLLHLFCSELSSDFKGCTPPSVCANSSLAIKEAALSFSTVKKRLESMFYQNSADFIADIRLIFGSCVTTSEADTEVTASGRKLKEIFEGHLRSIFPDQTFPEIKVEMEQPVPPDSQFSSPDHISQVAKRQRKGEE